MSEEGSLQFRKTESPVLGDTILPVFSEKTISVPDISAPGNAQFSTIVPQVVLRVPPVPREVPEIVSKRHEINIAAANFPDSGHSSEEIQLHAIIVPGPGIKTNMEAENKSIEATVAAVKASKTEQPDSETEHPLSRLAPEVKNHQETGFAGVINIISGIKDYLKTKQNHFLRVFKQLESIINLKNPK